VVIPWPRALIRDHKKGTPFTFVLGIKHRDYRPVLTRRVDGIEALSSLSRGMEHNVAGFALQICRTATDLAPGGRGYVESGSKNLGCAVVTFRVRPLDSQ